VNEAAPCACKHFLIARQQIVSRRLPGIKQRETRPLTLISEISGQLLGAPLGKGVLHVVEEGRDPRAQ
jgi:hypothetical protein